MSRKSSTVQINVRARASLRDQLQAAAEVNGVSANQEIVNRLNQTFAKEAEFGSAEETNLARLIASAFTLGGQRAAKAMKHPEWTAAEWMLEPFCYQAAIEAAVLALETAQPIRYASKHPDATVREQHAKIHTWAARVAAAGGNITYTKGGKK